MANVDQLKADYMQHLQRLARVASVRVRDVVAAAAPNGKPRVGGSAVKIRDSIGVTEPVIDGEFVTFDVFSTAPQALFTDQGTVGPYKIYPKSAGGVLFFSWPDGFDGDRDYAFRYVTHPGIAAQKWFSEPMAGYAAKALLESVGVR